MDKKREGLSVGAAIGGGLTFAVAFWVLDCSLVKSWLLAYPGLAIGALTQLAFDRHRAAQAKGAALVGRRPGGAEDRGIGGHAPFEQFRNKGREIVRGLLNAIEENYAWRPCPRCGETNFDVVGHSPNMRSLEVRCTYCSREQRFLALKADIGDTATYLRRLEDYRTEARRFNGNGGFPDSFGMELVSDIEASDAVSRRREHIPQAIRRAVWARDGGCCALCGAESDLQFDHVIPFSKGGATSLENLQLLCSPCNRKKSDNI